jgi:exopolysaccharide biosynthesis operon protein EpsL
MHYHRAMHSKPFLTGTAILLCAVTSTVARADQWDAFNATVSYSWLRDDNLFRLSDDAPVQSPPRSDNIHTLGFVGTFDKTISRQKLHAEVNLQDNRYDNHSFLNNQPYSAAGSWLWQFGNNLSGQLRHLSTRNISSFESYQTVLRDIYTTRTNAASIRYRVHPDWFVEAAAQNYDATHSALTTSDVNVREARMSLLHIRPNGDQIQLRGIRRHGDYPNHGSGTNYEFDEEQLDAVVTMVLTGASSVTASFGRLERRNPYAPQRDFSGQIGRLAWNWLPTGKLSLTASIERTLGAKDDILSTFALTDTLNLGATWALTDKMQLQFGYSRWRSNFRGDPGILPPDLYPQRKDDGRTLSLGLSYQLIRNLRASMQLASSRRDSNYATIPFRDNTLWLSVQWSF